MIQPQQVPMNNMDGNIPIGNVPIGGNQLQPPRWRARNIVVVPRQAHDLPRHFEKYITKFGPDRKDSTQDHLLRYATTLEASEV